MKSFKQFLNEADIKGNPAISPEYLNSLNQRAERSASEIEAKYGRDMGSLMRAVGQVQAMQRGKEKQLETLSKEVIMEQYGAILGETELDIRIPTNQREMKQKMDQEKPENQEMPTFKEIEDEDTKIAIHKRKIMNMFAQGEAINSKKMLLGDTNMEGLTKLFGEANATKMAELLVMITDICNARDWRIPEEVGARMIEMGNGLSGVSKIEWKPAKAKNEEPDDQEDEETEAGESTETTTPKLIILGLDQAMLFHEAVKAIIGLINQGGLAHLDDETIAKVFMNTDTVRDEVQDLKRAKLTAADLRDFLNTFAVIIEMENGREYVWGKMIDATVIPDRAFLTLMNQIFTSAPLYRKLGQNEPPYSDAEIAAANEAMPKATETINMILELIQAELEEWNQAMRDWERERLDAEYGEEDYESPETEFETPSTGDDESSMSPSEIQARIDQALDARDFKEVERLSKFLNENRQSNLDRLNQLGLVTDPKAITINDFKKLLRAEWNEYVNSVSHEDDYMGIWDFYSENARGYAREYGIVRNPETDELEYTWNNKNYSDEDDDDDYDY
jgi:hypothetical protein